MRIEQLKYFLEVAKSHSIGIASEKLYVTQPTVSIALKNLEQELDIVLFKRSKNGVFLTKSGRMILEKAQSIVDEEKKLRDLVSALHKSAEEELSGYLKICTIPMITHAFFTEAVLAFVKQYPKVHLSVLDKSPTETVEVVKNGNCDIGFFIADQPQIATYEQELDLVVKRFFSEKIYVVTGSAFSLEGKLSVSFEDIKDLPLATTTFTEELVVNEVFDQAGMDIVLKTNNLALLEAYILGGAAIGVVFNAVLNHIPGIEKMKILPVNLPYKIEVCCVYAQDNHNLPLINAFMGALMQIFTENSTRNVSD